MLVNTKEYKKEIRLNNTSEEKIQFSNNVTIDCKYRIDWKKISSTINTENIENKDIIAFGDGLNDIDMIEKCGVGVAMKNALPEVKEKSKLL